MCSLLNFFPKFVTRGGIGWTLNRLEWKKATSKENQMIFYKFDAS